MPTSKVTLDKLSDGRLLEEVYGYAPGWGFPSEADGASLLALMDRGDEEEVQTEGPPEVAQDGAHRDHLTGAEIEPGVTCWANTNPWHDKFLKKRAPGVTKTVR